MTFIEFTTKYNIKPNFLTFMGICSAVKKAVQNNPIVNDACRINRPNINFHNLIFRFKSTKTIDISKSRSKHFYEEFVNEKLEPPSVMKMWFQDLHFNHDHVYKSLLLIKNSVKEPKLLAIQFKIVHNITNCGSNLVKWKIKCDKMCEFCDDNVTDTLMHSLFECKTTKSWLRSIVLLLNSDPISTENVTPDLYLFGSIDGAFNLIFMIIKKYILLARCKIINFSPNLILKEIYKRIIHEKLHTKIAKFHKKWSLYPNLMTGSEQYLEIYQSD